MDDFSDFVMTPEQLIKLQIRDIEGRQARAIREHLLGDTTALARLRAIDNEIAALRAQLTPE
jgi:hypothetical protein